MAQELAPQTRILYNVAATGNGNWIDVGQFNVPYSILFPAPFGTDRFQVMVSNTDPKPLDATDGVNYGALVAASGKVVITETYKWLKVKKTVASGISIVAPATGAVRATNVVTITTTAAHGLAVGNRVTISGVTDSSFNGTFVILSTPLTTTFTYAQVAGDASSGNGAVDIVIKVEAYSQAVIG